ncbi:hypothetical protein [uncultured Parabacteroides sp.]|uniref:hypothetical protein n=1 Tax=uncultured Parabacteroides sp. TaxID=512312 RepID=UPI002626C211|nr:hypothetical protein [uncultured Parabacteroides sp.]
MQANKINRPFIFFIVLCRCGKTKAAADLKRMMQAGKLVRTFVGNAYLFHVPVDGV